MSPRIRWKNNYSKMGLRKKEWFSMVFSFHLDCLYSFIFFLHSSSFCFSPYSGKHFLTKTCTEFSLPFKDIFESPSLDRNCNFLEGWTLHKKLRCFFFVARCWQYLAVEVWNNTWETRSYCKISLIYITFFVTLPARIRNNIDTASNDTGIVPHQWHSCLS